MLLDEYEAGRTVVVLLDEAQTISAPNMATLLYLSNLQTATTKLVQIALLALPNFDRKLSYQPALSSRIATRGTLDPLIAADTVDMMRHRVTFAGGNFDRLFPEKTHRPIWQRHAGRPQEDLRALPQHTLQRLRPKPVRCGPRLRDPSRQRLRVRRGRHMQMHRDGGCQVMLKDAYV